MYSVLLALAVALAVSLGYFFFLGGGWIVSTLLGLATLLAVWVVLARRISKKFTPRFQLVQKQAESGHIELAVSTLEDLLPLAKWVPLLTGQIHGQIGILLHRDKPEKAREHLSKAGRRATDAQMLLAATLYRDKDVEGCFRTLTLASAANRRHALVHNFHAWLLNKEGRTAEAIQVLNRHLAKEPANEISKDNRLRLQNARKMNMKPFGLPWYMLGFERPPASMGQMQTARKGFRQPPKRRK